MYVCIHYTYTLYIHVWHICSYPHKDLVFLQDLVNVSTEDNFSPRCAFWDYGGNFSRGAWSFEGVTTKIVDNSHVQCLSTHMTSFAILVDLSGITVVCRRPVQVLVHMCVQYMYVKHRCLYRYTYVTCEW